MRFQYDKQADAFYIKFNEQPYAESDEIGNGFILDYNRRGQIIGLEILDASKRMTREFNRQLLQKRLPITVTALRT